MTLTLSIWEYCRLYPEDAAYVQHLTEHGSNRATRIHRAGFVKWDDQTAPFWGGPWRGNHVLAIISEHKKMDGLWTEAMAIERWGKVDIYTQERPFALYLAGNDDCSYTAWFANLEQAEGMLTNICTFPVWDSLSLFGFEFTN